MQLNIIPPHTLRSLIEEEFHRLKLCAQQKALVHKDGIVERLTSIQENYIKFAHKNQKTHPELSESLRFESMVNFQITKMVDMDLKDQLAPAA